jgi:hypothetical protein
LERPTPHGRRSGRVRATPRRRAPFRCGRPGAAVAGRDTVARGLAADDDGANGVFTKEAAVFEPNRTQPDEALELWRHARAGAIEEAGSIGADAFDSPAAHPR